MIELLKMFKSGETLLMFLLTQLTMIIVFAFAYWMLSHAKPCPAGKPNCHFYGLGPHSSLLDFFYYSLSTQTTVGYGDIVPMSKHARLMSMVQMSMIYLGIGITEVKIMSYITNKKYWQPALIISAFIVAAFAPPFAHIISFIFQSKKNIKKTIKHPKAVGNSVSHLINTNNLLIKSNRGIQKLS